ncbi:MAG: hypothetical protein EAX96_06585 [Candidatus Lokiarchaeota archaeon]|nr:hypothetical protein [Candidatus Lokiarchaeota archaeon]
MYRFFNDNLEAIENLSRLKEEYKRDIQNKSYLNYKGKKRKRIHSAMMLYGMEIYPENIKKYLLLEINSLENRINNLKKFLLRDSIRESFINDQRLDQPLNEIQTINLMLTSMSTVSNSGSVLESRGSVLESRSSESQQIEFSIDREISSFEGISERYASISEQYTSEDSSYRQITGENLSERKSNSQKDTILNERE